MRRNGMELKSAITLESVWNFLKYLDIYIFLSLFWVNFKYMHHFRKHKCPFRLNIFDYYCFILHYLLSLYNGGGI